MSVFEVLRKSLFLFALLLVCESAIARPQPYLDVKSTPPKKGTPEFVAVSFVRLLVAKDKKGCLELMDARAKRRYDDEAFADEFKDAATWKLHEEFRYKKRERKGYVTVTIQTRCTDVVSTSMDFSVRKTDGRWYISSR